MLIHPHSERGRRDFYQFAEWIHKTQRNGNSSSIQNLFVYKGVWVSRTQGRRGGREGRDLTWVLFLSETGDGIDRGASFRNQSCADVRRKVWHHVITDELCKPMASPIPNRNDINFVGFTHRLQSSRGRWNLSDVNTGDLLMREHSGSETSRAIHDNNLWFWLRVQERRERRGRGEEREERG
jgi:hypothetical protein